MPTPTYIALGNTTIAIATGSITFSSIPATYRDLIVVVQGGGGANLRIGVNGDTTNTNFSGIRMDQTGSSNLTGGEARLLNYYGFMEAANLNTSYVVQVMDYSATDKHKTYFSRSNNPANGVSAIVGRWANTSAITSVSLISESTFLAGSTLAIYGVIS